MKFKFIKTNFGWKSYALHKGAYIYFGHFYTQKEARITWSNP